VVWEITLACNLNCIHCGSSAGRARADELSTEEALKLCSDLKRIRSLGVALMGGEPLLRSDWATIAERVHDLGMDVSIITNGWSVSSDDIIKRLVELKPECVSVSLDGATPDIHDAIRGVPGSFQRAMTAIGHLVNVGLPTSVITTVHKLNLTALPAIRDLLVGKGIAWQIQMATPFGRLAPEYVLSLDEYYSVGLFMASTLKKYPKKQLMVAGAHDMGYFSGVLPNLQVRPWQGCQAGITTLGIRSNGDVLGCLALSDSFVVGNVRTRSLPEMWYDEAAFSFSRRVTERDLGNACVTCDLRKRCKGGCSAVSYSTTGGLHRNPYCFREIERHLVRAGNMTN